MAIFTAIGTAIATAIGGALIATTAAGVISLTLLGSVVAGVIAAGLAFGVSKLLGVFDVPNVDMRANGSKVQVAPATDNKIGVAYGRNFMSGPITDVAISNQNKTMHYCIVLSEFIEGETYTLNQIFWGDRKLSFSGAGVSSYFDANATTREDWSGKVRVRVYAGGTASAKQIFPTSSKVAATTMMPHWTDTTNYTMEGLVFVMMEVDYDAENSLTGLGSMSFDITNSMNNPGEVLFDYMTNTRYGAGLANADIDITSILGTANTDMKGYANELIPYTNKANVSANIARYQINGYLSTFSSCMDNIDMICRNSSTYFTFDGKQGKFRAIPNREYLTSELANAFILNDDNITSKISISSTELYQTLNKVTIEFADQNRKDQTNTTIVETPSGDRNTGEPDNNLDYRLELVNNNIHAQQLGNIDLNQSRKGMVVELSTDFSGLQIDAGDVVKLNNTDYGFSDRLFRVMKNTEVLGQDGMINCGLLLLEYDDSVYLDALVVETPEEDDPIDIPIIPPPPPIIPPGILSNFFFNVSQTGTSGSGSGAKFIVRANVTSSAYENVYVIPGTQGTGYANADVITVTGDTLRGQTPTHDLTFRVAGVQSGVLSLAPGGIQNVAGNALIYNADAYSNSIDRFNLGSFAAGGQVDFAPAANTSLTSNADVLRQIAPTVPIDLANIENGQYSILTNATPLGQIPSTGVADYRFGFGIDVAFANGTNITNFVEQNFSYGNYTHIPTSLASQKEFVVTDDMISADIRMNGSSTLATPGGGVQGFDNMKYDMFKVNKGDIR